MAQRIFQQAKTSFPEFTFKQDPDPQSTNAPQLNSRPNSNSSALPTTTTNAQPGTASSTTAPQLRTASNAPTYAASASANTPAPIGYVKGFPVYWAEACGAALPAGIVLRHGGILESDARVLMFSANGGTYDSVIGQATGAVRKLLEAGASAAKKAEQSGGGAAVVEAQGYEMVLLKLHNDQLDTFESSLTAAGKTPALLESTHLATTWIGAGKAGGGNDFAQAQLNALHTWLEAHPGRKVEICDINPQRFSALCSYLSSPSSLSDEAQLTIENCGKLMNQKDGGLTRIGVLMPPPGATSDKPVPVWIVSGQMGKEDPSIFKDTQGLILACNTNAMAIPDVAWMYAHKPGLQIGQKGMAKLFRDAAKGGDVIAAAEANLKAAAKANGTKELNDSQAVYVPIGNKPGKLAGKAVVLVNGPRVVPKGKKSAPTTPVHARMLEKALDNAVEQASSNQQRKLAFTGISTGEFGFNKTWGGHIIMQSAQRALFNGQVDTAIACLWDDGLPVQESVPGGALAALYANPGFVPN